MTRFRYQVCKWIFGESLIARSIRLSNLGDVQKEGEREREEESRGRLRNCVYVLRKRTSPLSNGITRIVPIYSNRLNTSSIAREYRGIPRNFSRMSTTDFLSKMATLPPSLANSFANRKTDFFPRTVTQTVRKISIESG